MGLVIVVEGPMEGVRIGAVGMGVINGTVVGMGILVAGVNVMSVWSVGMDGMGPRRLGAANAIHSSHHHAHQSAQSQNLYAYPSKQVALQKAKALGCHGVHAMGSLWMPCAQHP